MSIPATRTRTPKCARNTRPTGERVLVHLSNFRPVKRLTDVIEIFDRVHKTIPSKLLLIGDGPDRSVAEWLAVQKGIHEDVLFLGKQDQIQEKLAIADIMLLPSELESFGLGGARGDGVRSGSDFDPGRRRARGHRPRQVRISRRRGRCRDDGALCHRIAEQRAATARNGKAARAVAMERFCSTKIVKQYEDFYRRVLERSA